MDDGPSDRWHREAQAYFIPPVPDGTYELVGPKVQGNPEGFSRHMLIRHGDVELDAPREFNALKEYFTANREFEGIVWHHPDGRMVKIKAKDFGLSRSIRYET